MAGRAQGDQKAAVTIQVGQDQVEGGGGRTLQPASALLIIPSREVQSGSFSTWLLVKSSEPEM